MSKIIHFPHCKCKLALICFEEKVDIFKIVIFPNPENVRLFDNFFSNFNFNIVGSQENS